MNENSDLLPLSDAIDHQILMHRDTHFGGNFSIMLDYYQHGGRGAQDEFDLKRIEELKKIEGSLGTDLSSLVLDEIEKLEVESAKKMYSALKSTYENPQALEMVRLIADLILSEEEPKKEMASLIAKKASAVPSLIELISTDELYLPLFPGYGLAPLFAIECLGKIQDERAITPLFQRLGKDDFFFEEALCKALHQIGEKAKQFLLKALEQFPLSSENECAAIALLSFKEDRDVLSAVLSLLQNPRVWQTTTFAFYLILILAETADKSKKEALLSLLNNPSFPPELKQEIRLSVKKI